MLVPLLDLPPVRRWAVASQQRARRNAMIASSALTQRRLERVEVEEYLASLGEPARPDRSAAGRAAQTRTAQTPTARTAHG